MIKKILYYWKYFGLYETLKKIKRYLKYLKNFRIIKNNNYTSISSKLNINQTKKKEFYIYANNKDIYQLNYLIDVLNNLGYSVNFISENNSFEIGIFQKIQKIYKANSFTKKIKQKNLISFKVKYKKYIQCNYDDIKTLENASKYVDKFLEKSYSPIKEMISIIILNYNNKEIIHKCIDCIIEHSKKYNYEIIVVDNNSNDGSFETLKNRKDIVLLKNNKNGCSSGRNIGINNSRGKYILFLDSDQFVMSDNWLDVYMDLLIENKNNVIGWAAGWFNKKGFASKTVDFYEYRYADPAILYKDDIGYLGTGGMFLYKNNILKTDLFDEKYDPTSYEDTDISLQLKEIGCSLIYCPCLSIVHDEHQTTKKKKIDHDSIIKKNGQYFKNKWKKRNYNLIKEGIK